VENRQINTFCGYTGGFRLPPKDGGKTVVQEWTDLLETSTRLFNQEFYKQTMKDLDFIQLLYPPCEPLTYWELKKARFMGRLRDYKWRICAAWKILKEGDPEW